MKKLSKLLTILWTIIFAILALFVFYFANDYQGDNIEKYMTSSDVVQISDEGNYYKFDSNGDKALIFYQGALVDEKAYSPLMSTLAQNGIDCYLVKMPYNFAIFNTKAYSKIYEQYKDEYTSWYIAGHSLGGAMAEMAVADSLENFDGIFLLAAYGTEDISTSDIKVKVIYGENDKVMNMESLEKYKDNMPKDYEKIIIEGGNHAGFGSYGEQKGDGKATITNDEQIRQTANIIVSNTK